MVNNVKKVFSSVVVFLMLLSTVSTALGADLSSSPESAAPSDVSSHWASKEIGNWVSLGLVNGNPDGTFKPDNFVTRAEFFAFVNRMFKLVDKADVTFPDVKNDAWYADDMSKVVAAGIVAGDDNGNARPNDFITRQEAAVVIARAFDLQAKNQEAYGKFSDAGQVAAWSKLAVSAMVESGFIQGRAAGNFAPADNITRAESIKMIDNAMGELKNAPNTYTGNVTGNLVVNSRDVTLKDMTIAGDLYLTQGIGDGNVNLDGVSVKGRTIVNGGGENSVIIKNSSLTGTLIIYKADGKIRIVSQGSTEIPQVQLNSGAILKDENTSGNGFSAVQITQNVAAEQEIKFDGDFSSVSIEAPNVNVQIVSGTIGKMDVLKTAVGTTIQMDAAAVITDFTTEAQVAIKGTGTIVNAHIQAAGVTFEQKPTNVTIADGVTAVIAGQTSSSGTVTTPGGGSAGGGGGGGGGGTRDRNKSSNTSIVKTESASQVIAITEDTVSVLLGATFGQLVGELKSADGSVQTYNINGTSDSSHILKTQDILKVTAENRNTSKEYKIRTVDPTAIVPSEQGVNISDISGDVIKITSGDTYIYTVDTAEGAGRTTMEIKTVQELLNQITSATSIAQTYVVKGANGTEKQTTDPVDQGDILTVRTGKDSHNYTVNVVKGALRGKMQLVNSAITANTQSDVVLNFFAGMRSPATEVVLKVPKGIGATMDNTTVNVIGRGEVKLSGLATQSIGRTGAGYRFQQVGTVAINNSDDGSQVITFNGLDLRPANGADLVITFAGVTLGAGKYEFEASYTTSEPEKLTSPRAAVSLNVVNTISNFTRTLDKNLTYKESNDTYTKARFSWSAAKDAASVKLMQSTDKGATWTENAAAVGGQSGAVEVVNLIPNTEYYFKLAVTGGANQGDSNIAKFYTGKFNAKLMGAKGDGKADDTQAINDAALYLNSLGGGTLLFENGTFNVRTVHLQSNVYLYIHKDAIISALKGGDAPETAYFSDKSYRSGTSATDPGPYKDPENYMTKQDVGHTYFRNSMFFGERIDNFKIIGNGKITGNNNLVTGDSVMNNAANNRTDKMVTAKLSTNFEFGGLDNGLDLWYEETTSPTTDEPYYIQSINPDGSNEVKQKDISNMLKVDRAGHFAMLATGTDYINTHDFYYDKGSGGGARDVFDYMQSSYVTAKNIYAKGTSDDIVKPGSDSSLGFTRPATTYYVRNIIGDTNCNLFQIGSETVDDIKNAYVDNIYVLAGNKAGFSISTNDGGHVENIYLNYGQTGTIHHKSEMRRTRAPFFISISNRGRVIGGQAERTKWMENGLQRDELLSTNVNIGLVRNIFIKDVNIEEVYQGSQYNDPSKRWAAYNGNPNTKAAPIIAGYKVGDGGPTLPDGRSIGYIENLHFENVAVLVKGGNSFADSEISPPEMGVGKYNVADIKEQPSYGFWAKHVQGLTFTNVTTNFEQNDDRYAIVLDDVKDAIIDNMKMVKGSGNPNVVQLRNASNITVKNSSYYKNTWGNALTSLADFNNVTVTDKQTYPNPTVVDVTNTAIQMVPSGHPNVTSVSTSVYYSVTVITGSLVSHLSSQIQSTNGTTQTYSVTDSTYAAKSSGQILATGDILVVTAQDGTTQRKYQISIPNFVIFEGETTSYTTSGLSTSTANDAPASGGAYRQFTGTPAVTDWLEYTINVPSAGDYDVSFRYKSNNNRGTVQLSIDGNARGNPVDEYAIAQSYIAAELGRVTLSAGDHKFRFTITGKNASSTAHGITFDYVKLTVA